MSTTGQETEVKFYLLRPTELPPRILAAGGSLRTSRMHQLNLRFDDLEGRLQKGGRLLRLRRDRNTLLTYKDNTQVENGVLRRRELEIAVDDFDRALEFLRALDYEVVFIYEKYRTTYECGLAEIMLDELPFGNFVEIEGEPGVIRPLAAQLGLNWKRAIPRSYHALFEHLREARALSMRDLTFESFAGMTLQAPDLGVQPADD